jgi:nicotinate phosphoribosyltransferase
MDFWHLPLLTDLYEFTMAAGYHRNKMFAPATFSLFIRKYPANRGYFVNAGLHEVLDYLEKFHFESDDIHYLEKTGLFDSGFLEFLRSLRFTGEVLAIPEGRLFFKDEPILEVTAPIIEGQLIESFMINAVNLQVTIATKASRCFHAAKGKNLIDFSLRRTQGIDAGMKVARASYLAGFSGTSNVLAGKHYGIPVSGTMAHSFVESFPEEIDAFRSFCEAFPHNTVLLIDTYDTVEGARKAVQVAREMRSKGFRLKGVRLDSGEMAVLSREVRRILDEAGFDDVMIFASGGFDEFKIERFLEQGSRIDAFGVGTKMGVSADAPYTDIAYKLVEYDGRPVLKLSPGKQTLVSRKQVYRKTRQDQLAGDVIALRNEALEGEALLTQVMHHGRRTGPVEPLSVIRDRFRAEFGRFDEKFKKLVTPEEYPVLLGRGLSALQHQTMEKIREKELGES